ncbi:MAG: co-chaperone GroES [Melioribacteraceae bacterium]|nr:co-chaperone GroES [Melioribacteraceae bacterium]MCF8395345.1 co-chaperone GroES [Melioribacteraceae bacterium]MCF8418778.1 co-chaperone GroES [Melioribacteraceae bacterium]
MADFKIKPLSDRVIVKASEAEEISKGGIILPDTAKEKPSEGTVVAAGPGRISDDGKLVEMKVKVGDKVLFGKYSGSEVNVDGQEYLMMRESDIFGILN